MNASNTCSQVARAQSCANHAQHIERLTGATCRVACHVVRRDSSASKTELKSHLFELSLNGWTIKSMNRCFKREETAFHQTVLVCWYNGPHYPSSALHSGYVGPNGPNAVIETANETSRRSLHDILNFSARYFWGPS